MYALRHRRSLLFPPGLLALAFLLLLGCGVVAQQQTGRLKKWGVMRLVVAPPSRSQAPLPGKVSPQAYMPFSQLEHFRPWQTVLLTGNIWQDYFSLQRAQAILRQLHHDPNHDRGLRIRFGPQATYASLIRTLDHLYRTDVNRYWLDIYNEPTTLYTFTTYYAQPPIECYGTIIGGQTASTIGSSVSGCIEFGPFPLIPTPQEEPSFWARVGTYIPSFPIPASWAPLLHPTWRNSLYLLLLLTLVSGGRLFRQWQRA